MKPQKHKLDQTRKKPVTQQHNENKTKRIVSALDWTLRTENVRRMIKQVEKKVMTKISAEKIVKNTEMSDSLEKTETPSDKPSESLEKLSSLYEGRKNVNPTEEPGACTIDRTESETQTKGSADTGKNFIRINKWKLSLLQEKRRMKKIQDSLHKNKIQKSDFKLRQFTNVHSKYMMEFHKIKKDKKKINDVKSTGKENLPKNASMVQSRYMESFHKYLKKSRIARKKANQNKTQNKQINKRKIKKNIKLKPKMKRKINKVNTVANKKKLKKKKYGEHLKVSGRQMNYTKAIQIANKLKIQKKSVVKQRNVTHQPTRNRTLIKCPVTCDKRNTTKTNKTKKCMTKLQKKNLQKRLQKKYCCARIDFVQEELEAKYYERYNKWYALRHPHSKQRRNGKKEQQTLQNQPTHYGAKSYSGSKQVPVTLNQYPKHRPVRKTINDTKKAKGGNKCKRYFGNRTDKTINRKRTINKKAKTMNNQGKGFPLKPNLVYIMSNR
ncbi:hypothetical protein WDU94_005335 [Cyamophila willieti]